MGYNLYTSYMPKTLKDLNRLVEEEARQEGPVAEEELRVMRRRFRLAYDLAQLRAKRGMSQKELSELTGIAQGEISKIENANGNPTANTLAVLLDALGGDIKIVARKSDRPAA